MDYSVDNICAHINVDRTKEIYRALVADSRNNSAVLNFQKNIYMREGRLEEYLSPLGIDISKYQGLDPVSINQATQSVTYCGYYPLCVENLTELKDIVGAEHDDGGFHVNKTEFGFEFSFEYINEQIVLFFWAELPWLFMPPIEKPRYENKAELPEIMGACTL